jgi:nucleotide-binding universal stress UspA family protein
MFHKILLATDFSEGAKHALEHAEQLAQRTRAELVVLHVREEFPFVGPDGIGYVPPTLEAQQSAAISELLEEQTRALRSRGVTCRALTTLGAPHLRIASVAAQEQVDMIVVGSHGRKALGRLLLGSVAERLVRTASVPVLVVRAAEPS